MQRRSGSFALLAAVCSLSTVPCAAQSGTAFRLQPSVDEGPKVGSLGTRLSFLFLQKHDVSSGLEFGYSELAGLEQSGFRVGGVAASMVEWERSTRKMFHATLTARRSLTAGSQGGLYYGAGTGVYYIRSSNEFFEQSAAGRGTLDFRRVRSGDIEFGVNMGGGFEFHPFALPGGIDLDARFHLLPFAGEAGVRSVFILSAGLSFF